MPEASTSKATLKLNVPAQKLDTLSFAALEPRAVAKWVEELPLASPADASRQLYRAAAEVGQLRTSMAVRYAMLEILRPPIHHMCATLGRQLANQPAVLPANLQRIADYAQALQNQLAVGYKVVVADGLRNRVDLRAEKDDNARVVVQSAHRAISDLTQTLLRACQLYTAAPKRVWSDLHQLYLLCERFGRSGDSVTDPGNGGASTISEAYRRALLLACARPNKLRQRDLMQLFAELGNWVRLTALQGDPAGSTFCVNLMADEPPVYTALCDADGPNWRGLYTAALAAGLEAHLAGRPTDLEVGERTSAQLASHALAAFSEPTRRSFARTASSGTLSVAVGISNVHFHLAGESEFDDVISRHVALAADDRNPFLRMQVEKETAPDDVWANAFDVGGARMADDIDYEEPEALLSEIRKREPVGEYPTHDVQIVDTSPNGYCVRWAAGSNAHLQTGELLCVREGSADQWSVAVVRWIRTRRDDGTLVGIELLGPRAVPVGARVIQSKGGFTEYMRALLVPELKAIGQPALLIMPAIPFQEGHKIYVNHRGEESKAVLSKRVGGTESFNEFEFRFLGETPLSAAAGSS